LLLTEPLQVGQFAIVDGEPVDRGPSAGVFHGKGPIDDRAELFILAEGTTPAGEAFAGHVVSALGHSFASLDMSLTGSLRRLFIETESSLRDWNAKSIAQHRVALGMSAFGRRGEQAVIAQAGPAVAFHLHDGALTMLAAEGSHAAAIGPAPVEPQLTRLAFAPGDRLLLISSHALRELDDELIAGILALPESQILPDLYRRVQGMRQVTVVLVTGPGERKGQPAEEATDDSPIIDATTGIGERSAESSFQPSLFIEDEDAESAVQSARAQLLEVAPRRAMETRVPVMMTEAPAPLLRAAGSDMESFQRIAAEGVARAARSRAAVATIAAEAPRPAWRTTGNGHVAHAVAPSAPITTPELAAATNSTNRERKSQSFSRGLVQPSAPAARPAPLPEDLPLAAELAAGRRYRNQPHAALPETLAQDREASLSGAPLVRPRTSMGGRWKGNNSFGGGRSAIGGQLPPTWMVIMGALAVLLILAGAVTVPRLLSDDHQARIATLVGGAQQRITGAATQADAGQQRQMLTEARSMLLEARDLGASLQTDQLISQVSASLTKLDNVAQPTAVEDVASLEQFGNKPVAVGRMALADDAAYLLDVNSGQVISVPLGGAEPKVIYAENKDDKRGKPVAIAQLDQTELGGSVLLIADAANHLWAYSGSAGVRAIAFAGTNNLTISDIAVSGRDLFVLDAGQSTIFRFLQTAEGYPNAPIKAVQSNDLASARRLMVDTDYVTTDANGTVHRFTTGTQLAVTFSESGIDKRLVAPETAQPLANNELAFLDASNSRIVVLRRDGGFARQYRAAEFDNASAFGIRNGQAYIFSGARLRKVTF
jgi:hypothetical protein